MPEGFERYPFPRSHGPAPTRRGAVAFGVFLAAIGAVTVARNMAEGDYLFAAIALNVLGVLALLVLGTAPQRAPRRSFRYLNAVVMTRAERPPSDSWVHLAPTRAVRVSLLIGFGWGTLCLIGVTLAGVLQITGAIPFFNVRSGLAGAIIATVLAALFTAVSAAVSGLLIRRNVRNGSFGRRPSGVALGRTSVAVWVPGQDVEIPWSLIDSVSARASEAGSRRAEVSVIWLQLRPGAGPRAQMLAAEGYQVPSDALYSALRWYHAHPEAHWELGRVEGQRRIEGWRQQALSSGSGT